MSEIPVNPAPDASIPPAEPAGRDLWAMVGLVLAAESLLLASVIFGFLAMPAAGAFHLAVIGVIAGRVLRLRKSGRDLRHAFLLCATTAVLGPIGPAGVAMTLLLARWFARTALPFETWYASLFPEAGLPLNHQLMKRIESGEAEAAESGDLVPFIDLLSFGSRDQKQAMIALVATHFKPAFAPVLRMALHDSNGALRVQAASAIAKVENRFLERVLELSAMAARAPGDPATQLELARHYDGYAFAGILDDKRERENRELAERGYRRYLTQRPGDTAVHVELARLLVRQGEYPEAVEILDECVSRGDVSPQVAAWYMECLFHLRRFVELRVFGAAHGDRLAAGEEVTRELAGALRLWSAQDARAEDALPADAQ